ncbi:hypothetical protein OHB12_03240 [Nocardia sp. NBC_01730]|uniref:hypothetical protein n=1 Tax=Nocardia sp. NBC_01730 TaxID=2975998 RepID=UPI002E10E0A4|nr:hypothetical protein OHB12_03240 [Nocardia sp. NBC_01730]
MSDLDAGAVQLLVQVDHPVPQRCGGGVDVADHRQRFERAGVASTVDSMASGEYSRTSMPPNLAAASLNA